MCDSETPPRVQSGSESKESTPKSLVEGSDLFLWDTRGDVSVPPHFVSDFLDIDLFDRDLDTIPYRDPNRNHSTTCNRLDRISQSDITPERRRTASLPREIETESLVPYLDNPLPRPIVRIIKRS